MMAFIGLAVLLLSANPLLAQKSGKAEYLITIEAGKSKKQAELVNTLPEMLKVKNSMYFYKGKGIYVQFSDQTLDSIEEKGKTYIWKSGSNSYKYEAMDTNCCILYSNLKDRYTIESTSVVEEIAGYKAKKVILKDLVNNIEYLVWYTPRLRADFLLLEFFP
ncbi:hypothetical protein KFE98_14005 [bacterium SCSIO 12741]|nr:hypothetical protein KFE98_14005 [bacterium SCSIO 12741]